MQSKLFVPSVGKCSVAALELLAYAYFKDGLLPYLRSKLKEALYHQNWNIRESGILAIGAISVGCKIGMAGHLDELVPLPITSLSDNAALLRATTCWTLSSKYYFSTHWIVSR